MTIARVGATPVASPPLRVPSLPVGDPGRHRYRIHFETARIVAHADAFFSVGEYDAKIEYQNVLRLRRPKAAYERLDPFGCIPLSCP